MSKTDPKGSDDSQTTTSGLTGIYWHAADVCKEYREKAGVSRSVIAVAAGYTQQKPIDTFEAKRTRPRHEEQVLEAYASKCGTTASRIITDASRRYFGEPALIDLDDHRADLLDCIINYVIRSAGNTIEHTDVREQPSDDFEQAIIGLHDAVHVLKARRADRVIDPDDLHTRRLLKRFRDDLSTPVDKHGYDDEPRALCDEILAVKPTPRNKHGYPIRSGR